MSKYTTEVRFICENYGGFENSSGFLDVDKVLEKSWDKIFTTNCTFFDEEYRKFLCKKILKHYYLREINSETVGIWLLWLNTRLAEIMPYYNQLYNSELIKIDNIFNDTDYTMNIVSNIVANTTSNNDKSNNSEFSETTSNENEINHALTSEDSKSATNTTNETNSNTANEKNKYSDTPQGSLSDVENNKYLTNYRNINNTNESESDKTEKISSSSTDKITEKTTNKNSSSRSNNSTFSENNSNSSDSNENKDEVQSVKGKRGSATFASILNEYRTTFLNIDMLVINDFSDLFINLW